VRARVRDGDLPNKLAVGRDHEKISGTASGALGVEAEGRDVDVSVGTNGQALHTTFYPRLVEEIWQNGQDLNVAPIPCASRCRRENSDSEPERGRSDSNTPHNPTSLCVHEHDSIALEMRGSCVPGQLQINANVMRWNVRTRGKLNTEHTALAHCRLLVGKSRATH
jgi:hypothetical protein